MPKYWHILLKESIDMFRYIDPLNILDVTAPLKNPSNWLVATHWLLKVKSSGYSTQFNLVDPSVSSFDAQTRTRLMFLLIWCIDSLAAGWWVKVGKIGEGSRSFLTLLHHTKSNEVDQRSGENPRDRPCRRLGGGLFPADSSRCLITDDNESN